MGSALSNICNCGDDSFDDRKEEKEENKHSEEFKNGLAIIQHGFVKVDHFEHIYRLSPRFEGSPNLRQVEGFHIFGTGQPTKSAILNLTKIWKEQMDLPKCLWINMRSEPVIYVEDISLAAREPSNPSENIDFGHIDIPECVILEKKLETIIRKNIAQSADKKTFEYHKDTYAPLPADRKDIILTFECKTPHKSVFGLSSLYDTFDNIKLERITVGDERAPTAQDIVNIVNAVLEHSDQETAIVFNCQMGKGRTTEGMIIACLIKKYQNEFDENLAEKEKDVVLWPSDIPERSEEDVYFEKKLQKNNLKEKFENDMKENSNENVTDEDMKRGNFTIINDLVEVLSTVCKLDGDTIKMETDGIIDRCQHLTNMRGCIYLSKQRFYAEQRMEERSYWTQMGKQFLERYYVLIVFNAYLHDCSKQKAKKLMNYMHWIEKYPEINTNIGTLEEGRLKNFQWD